MLGPIKAIRPMYPWPGFYHASRGYMEGMPRWRFFLKLPLTWCWFAFYSRRDRIKPRH